MINRIFDTANMGISAYHVQFKDKDIEREYDQFNLPFLKQGARVGAVISMLSWLFYALLEPLNTPTTAHLSIYMAMLAGVGLSVLVYLGTYTKHFKHYHQPIIFIGVIANILTIVVKVKLYPDFSIAHYMTGIIFITVWMFSISCLRLNYSVITGLIYYAVVHNNFLMIENISSVEVITATYYMIISFTMGAVICIHQEIQSRQIFLAQKALAEEKHHHHHKSLHDRLTLLPNRELLEDRLHQAISLSARNHIQCAGLFIDLDKFKTINDQYGHMIGDLYLKEVASRLRDITRDTDTIARISGDEFFILLLDVKSEEFVLEVTRKIQENLCETFILAEKIKLKGLGASVGICLFPFNHCTPQHIINRADKAMYQVKRLTESKLTYN